MKDEININILNKLLNVLKQIEDNKLDQHEASFLVGTILKEMYVDSAIKKAEKLDENSEKEKNQRPKPRNISWTEYKNKL